MKPIVFIVLVFTMASCTAPSPTITEVKESIAGTWTSTSVVREGMTLNLPPVTELDSFAFNDEPAWRYRLKPRNLGAGYYPQGDPVRVTLISRNDSTYIQHEQLENTWLEYVQHISAGELRLYHPVNKTTYVYSRSKSIEDYGEE